ncbi:hypothetical protein F4782DRAFT_448741 [Xylaria castorea]|nr:hypothetical protein F4782DRAFT_448741 [Xylaria castorea]
MFRQNSIDSQTPSRDMHRIDKLLNELREEDGDFGRGLADEVKSTTLLINQKQFNNEKIKERRHLLQRKIRLVSDLTSRVRDASNTSGEWKDMEQLEQKEFEDILELVIGKEGSLDRIRDMSSDAMGRLKNLETETVERQLSDKIIDLEDTIVRIRGERNGARAAKIDALAGRTEALAERDAMRNRTENVERENFVLTRKLEANEALVETKTSRLDALEKEVGLVREENLRSGNENTELGNSLTTARASLKKSEEKLEKHRASLSETGAKLKQAMERMAHVDGLVIEKDEMVGQMEETAREKEAELSRLLKEKEDALGAYQEARKAADTSRQEHDQRVKQLEEEAKKAADASRQEHDQLVNQLEEEANKALEDQAALHGERMQEMQAVVDGALRENQMLSNGKTDMHHDLFDKQITIITLRKRADEEREAKESAKKEVDDCNAELDHQRQQGESAIAERNQQIEEVRRQKGERESELDRTNLELERVKVQLEKVEEELTTNSLALTEMEGQQQSDLIANKAIQERLAMIFMAQSGSRQSNIGRWLTFVQMAGKADFVTCGDQLTAQGRTWTILQQWKSQTVALPAAAANTVEELLVRLYGKVGEAEPDDEAVDLVRRLVVSAETIGQVPLPLVRYVIGEYLGFLAGKLPDYHAVAVAFGLHQLVSIVSRRCLQDVGELGQRLGAMPSDQSTSLGALWVLLGSDHGLELKGRLRERQEVSLPGGLVIPARYCPVQDVAVLILPGSPGFVWVLELAINGIRRVEAARLAVVENYEWRLKAIEGGQDIILPSEEWEWYCEMIGGA